MAYVGGRPGHRVPFEFQHQTTQELWIQLQFTHILLLFNLCIRAGNFYLLLHPFDKKKKNYFLFLDSHLHSLFYVGQLQKGHCRPQRKGRSRYAISSSFTPKTPKRQGKSTVAVHVALELHALGHRVAVLDIDLTGPSIPRMLGVQDHKVRQSSAGWAPVAVTSRLSVMSIAFLLAAHTDAVLWRGPKKASMIKKFLDEVVWGALDYLIIDTPPVRSLGLAPNAPNVSL